MGQRVFLLACFFVAGLEVWAMTPEATAASGPGGASGPVTMTVLYNNVPHDPRLETAWGMSCLVEHPGGAILFDAGGDGDLLLSNMARLGKDPRQIDCLVLSHIHGDHTGGLWSFLKANGRVTVHVPASFPRDFTDRVRRAGATVRPVRGPVEIAPGIWSSGEMGGEIKEQALIVRTGRGLVVITGCAHPGIVNMARRAMDIGREPIWLLMGGFHLLPYSEAELKGIVAQLQALGVKKVAPSHCTGDKAMLLFRQAWGDDFIDLGCGATIVVE